MFCARQVVCLLTLAPIATAQAAPGDEAARRKQEEQLRELMADTRTGACKREFPIEIDWETFPSLTWTTSMGTAVDIAYICDFRQWLGQFCSTYGKEPLDHYDRLVCTYRPKDQARGDPIFKEKGWTISAKGKTLTLHTNTDANYAYNKGTDPLFRRISLPGRDDPGSFAEQWARKDNDKRLAEQMELLGTQSCKHRFDTIEADWPSFGTMFQIDPGTGVEWAMYSKCDIHVELDAACTKFGSEWIDRFKKMRCVHKPAGDPALAGADFAVDFKGDTLIYYTVIGGVNRHLELPKFLEKVLPAPGSNVRGSLAEMHWQKKYDTELVERLATLEHRFCEYTFPKVEIDWKSFGPGFFASERGKINVAGFCDISSGLESFCAAKGGKKKIRKIKKFKCAYKKKGNKKFRKDGHGMTFKAGTLTYFMNLEGANLSQWVDAWVKKNLK